MDLPTSSNHYTTKTTKGRLLSLTGITKATPTSPNLVAWLILCRKQNGGWVPTPPLAQLMKYAVPVVLAFLILKYQNTPEELVLGNPTPMWCFIAATCAYWLMVGATKQNMGRKWNERLRHAALTCGNLSAISLLSMFMPYPAPFDTSCPAAADVENRMPLDSSANEGCNRHQNGTHSS